MSASRLLFGEDPRVAGASVVWDDASGTDVVTSATLEFSSGHAVFSCSTRAEPDQRVTIWGEQGRIDIEIPFNIPKILPTRITVHAGGDPPTGRGGDRLSARGSVRRDG